MKRIGYYYPAQILVFTTGFYLTQLALSGPFTRWSGVAWGLSVVLVIGVIMWNKWEEPKKMENKTDPLTRMADQLRAEKERLTNELESYKKTALIAQYDAIVAEIKELMCEDIDNVEFGPYMHRDEVLAAIAQYDPRKNNTGE